MFSTYSPIFCCLSTRGPDVSHPSLRFLYFFGNPGLLCGILAAQILRLHAVRLPGMRPPWLHTPAMLTFLCSTLCKCLVQSLRDTFRGFPNFTYAKALSLELASTRDQVRCSSNTPARTLFISGLKSRVLKLPFYT